MMMNELIHFYDEITSDVSNEEAASAQYNSISGLSQSRRLNTDLHQSEYSLDPININKENCSNHPKHKHHHYN
jgi:hypothetical protein